jgi:hypothetical protein
VSDSNPPLCPVEVTLDLLDPIRFKALAREGLWNGWTKPLFSIEEGRRIVIAYNSRRGGKKAMYDVGRDSFFFWDRGNQADPVEEFGATNVEGKKMYAIGSSSWCWSRWG